MSRLFSLPSTLLSSTGNLWGGIRQHLENWIWSDDKLKELNLCDQKEEFRGKMQWMAGKARTKVPLGWREHGDLIGFAKPRFYIELGKTNFHVEVRGVTCFSCRKTLVTIVTAFFLTPNIDPVGSSPSSREPHRSSSQHKQASNSSYIARS